MVLYRVLHRAHAVFCRQRLRRVEPQRAEQCVLQDIAGVRCCCWRCSCCCCSWRRLWRCCSGAIGKAALRCCCIAAVLWCVDPTQVSSPLPEYSSNKASLMLYKRQKLQGHLVMGGGALMLRQQQRLLLSRQQRRLILQRETEQQRKLQQQRMTVGIKANTLQRVILRETKCFL